MTDDESRALDAFAERAHRFCVWARGDNGQEMTVESAAREIASLYLAGMELSWPDLDEEISEQLVAPDPPEEVVDEVRRRADALPIPYYWKVFHPLTESAEEPVANSLWDDICDIYSDVASGLMLYEAGERVEAQWEWAWSLHYHWGRHAIGALGALHAYITRK